MTDPGYCGGGGMKIGSLLSALRVEVETYGVRYLVAEQLRVTADRLDPHTARRNDEREEVLRELGWWVYDGHSWTSCRTMLRAALRRAHSDRSWDGAVG